jgi:hypothetical protein
LSTKRYLDLDLSAGWYRFSVKPDHPNVLMYVVPGKTYYLLSDRSSIHEADIDEINPNTIGFSRSDRERNFGGLMADSEPVDLRDLYDPGTCVPLVEEVKTLIPKL